MAYLSDIVGASAYAKELWGDNIVLRWRPETERTKFVEVSTAVFDEEVKRNPTTKPTLSVYKARVTEELKGFIPLMILWLVIQFFLWKFLEWLWDNWKTNPNNPVNIPK